MTRFLAILLFLIGLLPAAASAETVAVRSGDHDGFTRILIRFSAPEDWVFGRVDDGFEFRPARADIAYRFDGIYDRIGRQRIADVQDLGDGRLLLKVECECHARAEELADGEVVLDVIRGPSWAPGTGADARLPDLPAQSDPPPGAETAAAPVPDPTAEPTAMPVPDPAPAPVLASPPTPAPVVAPEPSAVQASEPSRPRAPVGAGRPMPPDGTPDMTPPAPVAVGDRAGLPLTLPRLRLPVAQSDTGPGPDPSTPGAQPAPAAGPVDPGPGPASRSGASGDSPGPGPMPGPNSPDPAPDPTPPPPGFDPQTQARVNAIEEALVEQIARAAAQGLLDADMGEIDREIAAATPPAVAQAPAAPEIERPVAPETPRSHVTVATSVDRAALGGAPRRDETDEGDICLDPSLFDVTAWGGPVENGADIGAYRTRIVGEFDVANGDSITALARYYIYVTFGAEARALLGRFPELIERPDLLHAMAEVVDDGASEAAPDLVDQMACPGATALWAVLAQPELRPAQTINHEAVALSFYALPPHLRRHLGPGLADEFLAAGDRATADLIRAGIDRLAGEPTSESAMLSARFDVATGDVDRATETLDEVMKAGDATMPEALLSRVELTLENGGAVPEDLVVLLDGLALQHRGTETGRRMVDAAIRARASGTDLSAAFAQLDDALADGVVSPDRGQELSDIVFKALTGTADDTGFLLAIVERLEAARGLPPATRRAIAERLFDIGFTGPAREVLDGDGAIPEPEDRRLFARMALHEGRPEVVIGYLAGLAAPADDRLRAEAMALAGDLGAAARLYAEGNDRTAELRAAWRGGLWPTVAALDDGAMGDAARLMVRDPAANDRAPGSPGGAIETDADGARGRSAIAGNPAAGAMPAELPPLAAAQSLVDESRATRATLETLLERIKPPTDGPDGPVETGG